ncbi:riboflavin synthase [Patescibacteria group bacterium]|nr:riboflavin synthase [Patescibacteria group bacterium]
MFTGLVEEVGIVESLKFTSSLFSLKIKAKEILKDTKESDSILVNGVCLTVINTEKSSFTVEVINQTLSKTTLGNLRAGDKVNLERSLLPTTRLGGHLVTGDIDGVAVIRRILRDSGQWIMQIEVPLNLMKFITNQARAALEGISLTIAEKREKDFTVCLIPFTLEHTNLREKREGDKLNLEVDILAKYIEQILSSEKKLGLSSTSLRVDSISRNFLRRAGY